jgi:hypothetical protein
LSNNVTNRFIKKTFQGTTLIWDKKRKKLAGTVNYPFGYLQRCVVLFCSKKHGLVLQEKDSDLIYTFIPSQVKRKK